MSWLPLEPVFRNYCKFQRVLNTSIVKIFSNLYLLRANPTQSPHNPPNFDSPKITLRRGYLLYSFGKSSNVERYRRQLCHYNNAPGVLNELVFYRGLISRRNFVFLVISISTLRAVSALVCGPRVGVFFVLEFTVLFITSTRTTLFHHVWTWQWRKVESWWPQYSRALWPSRRVFITAFFGILAIRQIFLATNQNIPTWIRQAQGWFCNLTFLLLYKIVKFGERHEGSVGDKSVFTPQLYQTLYILLHPLGFEGNLQDRNIFSLWIR